MIKLNFSTYKGIEYIRLCSLSTVQAESPKKTLSERSLIKILKEDVVLNDCVLYPAYQQWFKAYSVEVTTQTDRDQETALKKQITVA